MGKNDTQGFAELIEQAQRRPDPLKELQPDISSPFQVPIPPDHHVVDDVAAPRHGGRIPKVPEFNYEAHVEFFSIPKQADEYAEVLNKILSAQALLRYEDKAFTKDGDFLVVICYLTYKPNPVHQARQRREAEDDDDIRRG